MFVFCLLLFVLWSSVLDLDMNYLSILLWSLTFTCCYLRECMGSSNMVTGITSAQYASWIVIGKKCYCYFQLGQLNDHLFGKGLFIRFTVRVFRERLSVCVCVSYPFGFEGGMWNMITSDHFLSFYFFLFQIVAFLCTFITSYANI